MEAGVIAPLQDFATVPLHVHALIDALGCGGAELLLADFVELAPSVDLSVTVGYLHGQGDDAALGRLRELGVEPELIGATSIIAPADVRRVLRHLARVRPDLVHTHLVRTRFVPSGAVGTVVG